MNNDSWIWATNHCQVMKSICDLFTLFPRIVGGHQHPFKGSRFSRFHPKKVTINLQSFLTNSERICSLHARWGDLFFSKQLQFWLAQGFTVYINVDPYQLLPSDLSITQMEVTNNPWKGHESNHKKGHERKNLVDIFYVLLIPYWFPESFGWIPRLPNISWLF